MKLVVKSLNTLNMQEFSINRPNHNNLPMCYYCKWNRWTSSSYYMDSTCIKIKIYNTPPRCLMVSVKDTGGGYVCCKDWCVL